MKPLGINFALRSTAFTAIELMMGLAITGLVLAALSSVLIAVGQGWRATDNTQAGAISETLAMARIANALRESRELGMPTTASNGGVSLMSWADDTDNNGGKKISEMASIDFDPDSGNLRLLRMNTTRYDWWSFLFGDLLGGSLASNIRGFVGNVYRGSPEVIERTLAGNVKSVRFEYNPVAADTRALRIDYTVEFTRNLTGRPPQSSIQTASITLRGSN